MRRDMRSTGQVRTVSKIASPALVLFFLAPVIPELLTGSTPPAHFFNPMGFALLCGLYGSGAVFVRELTHRWGKGWPTLLTLGAAYGIIEEGLMVRSFFNPNWPDLGILAQYGRWIGVNWVWVLQLTVFHSVFSIAIPILLVNLVFPNQRSRSWVRDRTLFFLGAVLVIEILLGFILFPYGAPPIQYLTAVIAVAGLFWLAKRLPHPMFARDEIKGIRSPFIFGLVGALGTFAFFLVFWGLPSTGIPAPVTMGMSMGYVALVAWVILRMTDNGSCWSDTHQLGLVGGAVSPFIIMAPLRELSGAQPKNLAGISLVALVFVVILGWMAVRIRRREPSRTRAFCSNCGVAVMPDDFYCHECGERLWSSTRLLAEKE